jgi:hypothetical protein
MVELAVYHRDLHGFVRAKSICRAASEVLAFALLSVVVVAGY